MPFTKVKITEWDLPLLHAKPEPGRVFFKDGVLVDPTTLAETAVREKETMRPFTLLMYDCDPIKDFYIMRSDDTYCLLRIGPSENISGVFRFTDTDTIYCFDSTGIIVPVDITERTEIGVVRPTYKTGPLTQEQMFSKLLVDDIPFTASSPKPHVNMVVAYDDVGGIGYKGGLPWPRFPKDMARFKELTMGRVCIVGGRTAATLPKLEGRELYVIDREWLKPEAMLERIERLRNSESDTVRKLIDNIAFNIDFRLMAEDIEITHLGHASTIAYLAYADIVDQYPTKEISVIGGAHIYDLFYNYVDIIHSTEIHKIYNTDTKLSADFMAFNKERVRFVIDFLEHDDAPVEFLDT